MLMEDCLEFRCHNNNSNTSHKSNSTPGVPLGVLSDVPLCVCRFWPVLVYHLVPLLASAGLLPLLAPHLVLTQEESILPAGDAVQRVMPLLRSQALLTELEV